MNDSRTRWLALSLLALFHLGAWLPAAARALPQDADLPPVDGPGDALEPDPCDLEPLTATSPLPETIGWVLERSESATMTRVRAEFEPQAAITLAYRDLVDFEPEVFSQVIAAVRGRVPVIILVTTEGDEKLAEDVLNEEGVSLEGIHFVAAAHDTMWVRDYGPLIAEVEGRELLLDGDYASADRSQDDNVPGELGTRLGLPVRKVPLDLDGGNLLTNGRGLFIATRRLLEMNEDRGYDEPRLREVLRAYYGSHQLALLERLVGEDSGHVDMFATFTAADTIVVGAYDPDEDPENSVLLDRNAARLEGLPTPSGPLRVVRIPMPPSAGGLWRTYTNVLYANGVLLVPSFSDVDRDAERRALETYERLLPGWEVVGIESTSLVKSGGALHCISLNLGRTRSSPLRRFRL